MPSLRCLGLSYRTAPVEVRERVSLAREGLDRFLQRARQDADLPGLVVISTCGRTECYVADRSPEAEAKLLGLFSEETGVPAESLRAHLYTFDGEAAVEHLCRVASGLDSAIPGEPQILGQVSEALEASTAQRAVSPALRRLFHAALRCGRRARRETGLNRASASLGALAAALAARQLGSLRDKHAVVVGVGEMGRLALKALHTRKTGRITIANRNHEAAITLAERFGGHASCLHGLPQILLDADLIVTATAASEPILDAETVRNVLAQRPDRPLLLVDLGLPRNIAPDVRDVPGVTLYDLDVLKARVEEGLDARRREIPLAEAIVAEEVARFVEESRHAGAEPLVRDLRRKAERIRRDTLDRTLRHLPGLDETTRKHLDYLTHALVNRLLHDPTAQIREEAGAGGQVLADAVRVLFDLENDAPHGTQDAPLRDARIEAGALADAVRG